MNDSHDHDLEATVGKPADLIVVEGDPLRSIREIRNLGAVIANGRMFDTATLWRSVGFQPGNDNAPPHVSAGERWDAISRARRDSNARPLAPEASFGSGTVWWRLVKSLLINTNPNTSRSPTPQNPAWSGEFWRANAKTRSYGWSV